MQYPSREQQITLIHADLIKLVVRTVLNPERTGELEGILTVSQNNGWTDLVERIRRILTGERSNRLLLGLDDEDTVIISAILGGIQDPSTLPDKSSAQSESAFAAPGLAQLIHQSATGNPQALQMVSHLAEQMSNSQGDMKRLGGIVKRLIDGNRDIKLLSQGMTDKGHALLESLLEELERLESSIH